MFLGGLRPANSEPISSRSGSTTAKSRARSTTRSARPFDLDRQDFGGQTTRVQDQADRGRASHRGRDSADLRRAAGALQRPEPVDRPDPPRDVHAAAERAAGADRAIEAALRRSAGGDREDPVQRGAGRERRGRRTVLAGLRPSAESRRRSTPAVTPTAQHQRRLRRAGS